MAIVVSGPPSRPAKIFLSSATSFQLYVRHCPKPLTINFLHRHGIPITPRLQPTSPTTTATTARQSLRHSLREVPYRIRIQRQSNLSAHRAGLRE